MQAALDMYLERLALAERGKAQPEDDPEDETDIILNYPLEYVLRTWQDHRSNGGYPETGGYNDQDAQLMDDWAAVDERFFQITQQIDRDEKDPETNSEASHWTNLA